VREVAAKASRHCAERGSDIAKLALQYSIANPDMTTCITGSASPQRIAQWAKWAAEPIDPQLLKEVLEIFRPIHNWFYIEGRPENNDPLPA
jgi:aryl-alcohol dehydrogenase-like predicted oxidoreductase